MKNFRVCGRRTVMIGLVGLLCLPYLHSCKARETTSGATVKASDEAVQCDSNAHAKYFEPGRNPALRSSYPTMTYYTDINKVLPSEWSDDMKRFFTDSRRTNKFLLIVWPSTGCAEISLSDQFMTEQNLLYGLVIEVKNKTFNAGLAGAINPTKSVAILRKWTQPVPTQMLGDTASWLNTWQEDTRHQEELSRRLARKSLPLNQFVSFMNQLNE